jgi:glycosyltransferase involved in cell wall biosynthesis
MVFYDRNEDLPMVSVIISAHNEESCIKEKVESIFAGNYPDEKFEVLVGSDHSTDKTADIIRTNEGSPSLKFCDC